MAKPQITDNATRKYDPLKRGVDVTLSVIALCAFMPILALTAIAVIIEDRGPIFYKQERVGRFGELFQLLKFRSMTNVDHDHTQQVRAGTLGVTQTGRIIRRLKIDELPQLLNVLVGDLSLIGPRPCLLETSKSFGKLSDKRHSIRPGLSGLAQVRGNILLTWEERLAYDLEYINRRSLWLDCKILLLTVFVVIFGESKKSAP